MNVERVGELAGVRVRILVECVAVCDYLYSFFLLRETRQFVLLTIAHYSEYFIPNDKWRFVLRHTVDSFILLIFNCMQYWDKQSCHSFS